MVYQHFSLFDTLTAAENVWLGLDKSLDAGRGDASASPRWRSTYGLDVDPLRPVHTLSVGERQRVEIVRALLTNPKLLILDEPTSVLTPQAVDKLFVTLRQLAAEGCSILYISHKLDEIRALCHHCTVLRGGKVTGEVDPTQESNASLSRLMIGAEPPQLQHQRRRKLGARGARGAGPDAAASRTRSASTCTDIALRGARRRDRRRRRRLGQRPAGADGRAVGRGPARAAPASITLFGQPTSRHHSPRRRRKRGPALRARGAARPRRGADAVAWRRTRC